MALQHLNATATTTAAIIFNCPTGVGKVNVYIRNNSSTIPALIGDSSLSATGASQGLTIPVSTTQTFQFDGGTTIWGITGSSTAALTIITTGI